MNTLTAKLKSIATILSLARTTTERCVTLLRLDGLMDWEIALKLDVEPHEVAVILEALGQRYQSIG